MIEMKSMSTFVSCVWVCVCVTVCVCVCFLFSHWNHILCVYTFVCRCCTCEKTKQSINMKSLYCNCVWMSLSDEQKVPFALSFKKLMIRSAHQLTEATFRLQARKPKVWPSWKTESSGIKRSIQKWKYLLMDRKSPVLSHPFFVSVCVTVRFFFMCVFTPSHTQRPSLSLCFSLTKGEFVLRWSLVDDGTSKSSY